MSSQVSEAQRSYGISLAATSSSRQALLLEAKTKYLHLFAAACAGDYEAQCEIGRAMGEPKTMADLEIDPVEVLAHFPSDWTTYLLGRHAYTASELITAAQRQDPGGPAYPRLQGALVNLGRETGDPTALDWVSEHGEGPDRTAAFSRLGNSLLDETQSVNSKEADESMSDADIAALTSRVEVWLSRTPGFVISETIVTSLQAAATKLRWRIARVEGISLHQNLADCFGRPIAELAIWLRTVEHIMRQSDDWIIQHLHVTALADVTSGLSEYVGWSRLHMHKWGGTHMIPSGFAPGEVLPPFAGTCPNCISWLGEMTFCRQCGTKALS